MIGTSISEYIFIRTSIFALRAVTPVSVLYCVFSIFKPPQGIITKTLVGYAAVETLFYLLVYLPRKSQLQSPARHPPLRTQQERSQLFQRCCSTITDFDGYLHKWFLGSPRDEIKKDNIKDFYRWAFLNSTSHDSEYDQDLESYIEAVEDRFDQKFEPGLGKATCLRLTTDPVDMIHRPFLWYMIVALVDLYTAARLRLYGYRHYRSSLSRFFTVFPFRLFTLFSTPSPAPNLPYWYRPHISKTRPPILFIHGIGVGLYPYTRFLGQINEKDEVCAIHGDVGVIAIELMPISSRITHAAPTKDEMCRQINAILKFHGWNKFVLVSHSYGTVIATHLLGTPEISPKIGPMLLVDPVCILLHQPDVAYNFTARKPREANEHQLYYFASKDIGIAHTLHRHFFWSENIMWKEDLAGRDVTVSLGGRDLIVDTNSVSNYLGASNDTLTGNGLEVVWFPQCDHAQSFDMRGPRQTLIDVVRRYSMPSSVL